MEKTGLVTFKGGAVTLVGREVKPGDPAPDFTVVGTDMKPVSLADLRDTVLIINAVPSLDTPVCSLQTKRFNDEAKKLKAKVVAISMDLPFAQKRFAQEACIEGMTLLSDYKDRQFGEAYGLYIKELGLLARAVLIIDRDGRVAYEEIVKEIAQEPNYDQALAEARKLGA